MSNLQDVKDYFLQLQDHITQRFLQTDEHLILVEDSWQRDAGGGGRTRALSGGKIFEKGGINFSHVYGNQLPPAASALRPHLVGRSFQAIGVSVVMHASNPYVPTSHANVRFFISETEDAKPCWWFGGGYDLTPYYGFDEDCQHWHRVAKNACDPFGADVYPRFKQWCDQYFYLKHRQEPRGIGGLFFDDLNRGNFDDDFALVKSIANSYMEAYLPIVEKRHQQAYGEREKAFQNYRRGRYVEFNLLYDRGTIFGLQSGGRTESILMSLPPTVNWRYNWQPEINSEEARLYLDYLIAREWV